LELLHGLIYMELRSSPRFQYSVDAQGDTVTPLENSTVRVDLDQPPAAVAVLDGRVRVTSVGPDGQQGQQAEVSAGQTLRREGLGEQTASVQYLVKDGIDPDSWDQWNRDRDRAAAEEAANRTPARDGFAGDQGYGWSDLDANGSWYNLPGQGPVWQPDVAAYGGADGGIDSFDTRMGTATGAGRRASATCGLRAIRGAGRRIAAATGSTGAALAGAGHRDPPVAGVGSRAMPSA
jgi:hypothetical protein